MFIEHNWTACCWSFRIGQHFTDFRHVRSFGTLAEWKSYLGAYGFKVVRVNRTLYRVEQKKEAGA